MGTMSRIGLLAMAGLAASQTVFAGLQPSRKATFGFDVAASADEAVVMKRGSNGDIYVAGRSPAGCSGAGLIYVARLSPDLVRKWEVQFDLGGCKSDVPYGIAVSGDIVYVAGQRGTGHAFITKVNAGATVWTFSILPSPVGEGFRDVAIATDGTLWTADTETGTLGMDSVTYHLRDNGSSYTLLARSSYADCLGTLYPCVMVSRPDGIWTAGRSDQGTGRAAACIRNPWGQCLRLQESAETAVRGMSFDSAGNAFILVSRTAAGSAITLMYLRLVGGNVPGFVGTVAASAVVGTASADRQQYVGGIAAHPSMPLAIYSAGGSFGGYDTNMREKWKTAYPAATEGRGAAVTDGYYFALFTAETVGLGGDSAIQVSRYQMDDAEKEGHLLVVAPNVLDLSSPDKRMRFLFQGKPGGTVKLYIYNLIGDVVKDFSTALDSLGRGEVVWTGEANGGTVLTRGSYWAVAEQGSERSRKAFAVVDRRQ